MKKPIKNYLEILVKNLNEFKKKNISLSDIILIIESTEGLIADKRFSDIAFRAIFSLEQVNAGIITGISTMDERNRSIIDRAIVVLENDIVTYQSDISD